MSQTRLARKYLVFEMLPGLGLGIIVFIAILLIFQALRLTNFFLVHGVDSQTLFEIVKSLTVSFLPAIFPMSILFSVLLTYGRLTADSEITALRSLGISPLRLIEPAFWVSLLLFLLSAHTSFLVAPHGNRHFEIVMNEMGSQQVASTVRAGTFSEGFFDLVIYSDQYDIETGRMENIFIYDAREETLPLTVISKRGRIIQDSNPTSRTAKLELVDGNIHRSKEDLYTKIDFKKYTINLEFAHRGTQRAKSMQSMTLNDLNEILSKKDMASNMKNKYIMEYHKRWSTAFACVVFALLGSALGMSGGRRTARSSGMLFSVTIIVLYWLFLIFTESLAKSDTLNPYIAAWFPNFVFSCAFFLRFKTLQK